MDVALEGADILCVVTWQAESRGTAILPVLVGDEVRKEDE
jgi:hypothetical protein